MKLNIISGWPYMCLWALRSFSSLFLDFIWQTNVGTPFYMSPELVKGLPYDERCIIYFFLRVMVEGTLTVGEEDLWLVLCFLNVTLIQCHFDRSDIWALGCFIYELSSLRPPFEASNHLALAMKVSLSSCCYFLSLCYFHANIWKELVPECFGA